ncbi:hydroxymethylbilane synthase [Chloroflexota bacterium]
MRKKIVIGSRGSKLAIIQAEAILTGLRESNPEIDFSIISVTTRGDREKKVPLERIAGVGVFVKELEETLLDGRIDIAVHSLKDMPVEIPRELSLVAVGARLDPRDVLVSRGAKLAELRAGSRIGTGSLRRMAQLFGCRPDLKVETIRGNIDTRLNRVSSGDFDGVMLAAAAMIRMGWEERITEYLPLQHFLPAVGQGALGLEIRSGDEQAKKLVFPINHQPTWCSVVAERAFLQALGGGCRAPIAALGIVNGDNIKLEGMVSDPGGQTILSNSEEGSISYPEQVGVRLARKMLEEGASQIIAGVKTL